MGGCISPGVQGLVSDWEGLVRMRPPRSVPTLIPPRSPAVSPHLSCGKICKEKGVGNVLSDISINASPFHCTWHLMKVSLVLYLTWFWPRPCAEGKDHIFISILYMWESSQGQLGRRCWVWAPKPGLPRPPFSCHSPDHTGLLPGWQCGHREGRTSHT